MENRYKELMANAMKKIGELQSRLKESERDTNEPIAIVAMGCRLPGGTNNPQAFWDILATSADTCSPTPSDRWDSRIFYNKDKQVKGKMYCNQGSFIDNAFDFDSTFFNISPREARLMDPQQRLLLEVTWQTLEHGGLPAHTMRQSKTGVFIGTMGYDFLQSTTDANEMDVHSATGVALSALSGRLSHFFDFTGPTLTLDTACSSSLVAVHLACDSLRRGESDFALAGGVNIMSSPYMGIAECAANMLAPDGRCKTFDASANGYGRGEGCAIVLLKRLSDALRDGDHIIAQIRASAVNHDGQASALTVPNSKAQCAVMDHALKKGDIHPEQVAYIEAHGTGTPLGDPIEIEGLDKVYAHAHTKENPLIIGAVKSNIGHLEGAAGIAGLIKTALCIEKGILLPNQNFQTPNPHIDWENKAIRISTELTSWPKGYDQRIAGISSFGFSGTNAHIILSNIDAKRDEKQALPQLEEPALLTISAKSAVALSQMIDSHIEFLKKQDNSALKDYGYSTALTRDHFEHRLALSCEDGKDAINQLIKAQENLSDSSAITQTKPAFYFGVKLSNLPRFADLYREHKAFKTAFDQCDKTSKLDLNADLHQHGGEATPSLTFACQYSLAKLFIALNILPNHLVADGIGHFAAGCVGGILPLETAFSLIENAPKKAFTPKVSLYQFTSLSGSEDKIEDMGFWQNLLLASNKSTLKVPDNKLVIDHTCLEDGLPACLGRLYQSGANPDWSSLYQGRDYNKIALPPYPFQRQTYRATPAFAQNSDHPLLGQASQTQGNCWINSDLLTGHDWLLDHRIGDQSVYPAVAFIEMAHAAFKHQNPDMIACLDHIEIKRPLLLSPNDQISLKTSLLDHQFEIFSSQDGENWTLHALGEFKDRQINPNQKPHIPSDLDQSEDGAEFYQRWQVRGNDWRGLFQSIDKIHRLDDQLIGKITFDPKSNHPAYFAHPALLDACGHLLADFALDQNITGRFMAREIRGATFFKPLDGQSFWVSARLNKGSAKRELNGSLEIRNQRGDLLIAVDECLFTFIDMDQKLINEAKQSLYTLSWEAFDLSKTTNKIAANWTFNALDSFDLSCLKQLCSHDDTSAAAIHLDFSAFSLKGNSTSVEIAQTCQKLINQITDLRKTASKLWIITQNAWSQNPAQAAFWGLGRTIAAEQPDIWGGLIDLSNTSINPKAAKQIGQIINHNDGQDQFRIHDGQIQHARLVPHAPSGTKQALVIDESASYLITGGLGAIGLTCAKTLVERGAKKLILMGRSGLPPRDQWEHISDDHAQVHQVKAVRELEAEGAEITSVAIDISNREVMTQWLENWPHPIKGVIHSAGIATRQKLENLDSEDFRTQYQAKIDGLCVLGDLLEDQNLDFFIAQSSASAVLNSAEFGAYASANAFMDAYMMARQSCGKTGLSIAWGPWKDAGMAVDHLGQTKQLITPVNNQDAMETMMTLAPHHRGYCAVLPIDQIYWQERLHNLGNIGLLSGILKSPDKKKNDIAIQIDEMETSAIQHWLGQKISSVFNLDPATLDHSTPINQLGMDSLMALEISNTIKNETGLDLGVVELMEGLSVAEICELLQSRTKADIPTMEGVLAPPDNIELGHAQKSLWFIQKMAPQSAAYNVGFALHIKGTYNQQRLQQDWVPILQRHPILGARLDNNGENLIFDTSSTPDDFIVLNDLTGIEGPAIKKKVEAAYRQPFDLENGPLLRLHLMMCRPDKHILLIVAHHILCDGWSLWHLLEEFSNQVKGLTNQRPKCSYKDFLETQKVFLQSEKGKKERLFWQAKLSDERAILNLPHDHARPTTPRYVGATHTFVLDQGITSNFKKMARTNAVSDYVALLSLYALLLNRYSAQDDIIIGCPTTGRNQGIYENVIGHFVNPVAMRTDLSGDPLLSEFLKKTKATVLEALSHQDYPFSLLVEDLHSGRDQSTSAIFQTDFTFQQPHKSRDLVEKLIEGSSISTPLTWGDLAVLPFEIAQQEGQFDISFDVIESNGCFHCSLKYDTDLFNATTIEQMARHFTNLAISAPQQEGQPLSRIEMLDSKEKAALLPETSRDEANFDYNDTIINRFCLQARQTPEKIAVIHNDQSLTYKKLDQKSSQVARTLAKCGIKTGDFIGILDLRGIDFLVAILGVMKAGGAYVPIDPDYPTERIAYMVEDSACAVLITRSDFIKDVANTPTLKAALLLDDEDITDQPFDIYYQRDIKKQSKKAFKPIPAPTDRAYMIYTSGSTGKPKGAIVRHNGALNHILAEFEAMSFHEESAFLQSAPSSSDISVWQFLAPLLIGGRTVIADFATVCNIDALYGLIKREKVTVIELVPLVLDELIQKVSTLDVNDLSLEWGMVTGEAASVDLINRWFDHLGHVPLINAYGPTEAADDVCQYILRDKLPEGSHNVPVGQAISNMHIYILDKNLQPVPTGVAGEICVSGIGVGEGYWNNIQKTQDAFVPNPHCTKAPHNILYRCGDMGRWRKDGNLECLGRNDHQIKIRGHRIEAGEIEACLLEHDKIHQVLVTDYSDETTEKCLVAYLRAEPENHPQKEKLRTFILKSLPAHMVPAHFIFIDAFDILPNGKINRKSLPAPKRVQTNVFEGQNSSKAEQLLLDLWREILDRNDISKTDNFFELGGHSLLMAKLHQRVCSAFETDFPLVTMFQYPSVASLAGFLAPNQVAEARRIPTLKPSPKGCDIAIIGMACRFPQANSPEEFWQLLVNKQEAVTTFSKDDLKQRGVADSLINHPDFVARCAPLDGLDQFDAAFFGYNAREAELMDPQQRIFLECAWETLENAGYAGLGANGPVIGCFAGQGPTSYLSHHVQPALQQDETAHLYQVEISNDKDYIATNAGYKLNLQGPCLSVQTACSTSLVAIHMACKAIQDGECDMALAGSISANVLHQSGYLYQDGMILSPDGHCRPFDAAAQGTIPGSGIGIVMLKPLEDALRDNDMIHGVIKGSAVNNDGSLKAGYTAPSVDGQISVIKKAYETSGIDPQSIGYVCAHGTGTPMGDPIEISAFRSAFDSFGDLSGNQATPKCAIGSVKANIGHTDTAAGVASLICAIMAMKHKTIPAQLHFNSLNPALDLAGSHFFIPTTQQEWVPDNNQPRRACVSSLGIGGTNAHLIVEEAPNMAIPPISENDFALLPLSAKTKQAMEQNCLHLGEFLKTDHAYQLPEIAQTLMFGRAEMDFRAALVCKDLSEAQKYLASPNSRELFKGRRAQVERPVTFMFSGQGAQFKNMGKDLYNRSPVFKDALDEVFDAFAPYIALDLKDILFSGNPKDNRINQTLYTQPLLFAFEYANAKLVESYGVHAESMIGHSIGEYCAACLCGVFSLNDACKLVAIRAKLMQSMEAGAMCALHLDAQSASRYLCDGLDLAASNSSRLSVLSGTFDAVDQLEKKLEADSISYRRLHTSHAFHSASMEGLKDEFIAAFNAIDLQAPHTPFVSNLSGDWITADQACDPQYWYAHLRHCVKFSNGLDCLLENDNRILLELGPANALATFALQHSAKKDAHLILTAHQGVYGKLDGKEHLLKTIAQLWTNGVPIDFKALTSGKKTSRVALPTYAFQHQRYWIDPAKSKTKPVEETGKINDLTQWFHQPDWQRKPLVASSNTMPRGPVLIFLDDTGLGQEIANKLTEQAICVSKANSFEQHNAYSFSLNPEQPDDYEQLFATLDKSGKLPKTMLHFWAFHTDQTNWQTELDNHLQNGFASLLHIAKSIGKYQIDGPVDFKAILWETQDINGDETINPASACCPALMKVIAQENPVLRCQSIDLNTMDTARLWDEITTPNQDGVIAYRGKHRWVQIFSPINIQKNDTPPPYIKAGGTYIITGGLGYLGGLFARHFARFANINLVLTTRKQVKEDRIELLDDLQKLGATVRVLAVDITNDHALTSRFNEVASEFGSIDGVLHCAGVTDQDFVIEEMTPDIYQHHLGPKIHATLALDNALSPHKPDFVCLFSSLAAYLGGLRYCAYASVNLFMDSYCSLRNRTATTHWQSINWDGWRGSEDEIASTQSARADMTIHQEEGVQVFDLIRTQLGSFDQIVISVSNLQSRIEKWITPSLTNKNEPTISEAEIRLYARPDLDTPFATPLGEDEIRIANIWQDLLGLESVGRDDNFFDLGGHSLLGTQLITRLRRHYGAEINIGVLFENPTIAELAAIIEETPVLATQYDREEFIL